MFTKPINLPTLTIDPKARSKKKSLFNAYILCFLTLILCIILILAYRIEVKVIQQNLRKNYEDYVDTLKKNLADEENMLILEKTNYEPKKDDYVEIYIKTFDEAKDDFDAGKSDYDNSDTKYEIGTEKNLKSGQTTEVKNPTSGQSTEANAKKQTTANFSIRDELTDVRSENSDEISTENTASEKTSAEIEVGEDDFSDSESSEEDLTTFKPTESKIEKTTPKKGPEVPLNNSTNKLVTTTPRGTSTKSNTESSRPTQNTPKAVPVKDYVTQSRSKPSTETPTKSQNSKKTQKYDPNRPGIVVIQVEEVGTRKTTEPKYYVMPKIDGVMKNGDKNIRGEMDPRVKIDQQVKKTTPVEESMEDEEIPISDMEKKILETFNNQRHNGEIDLDPPNEAVDLFQSNIGDINKVIDKIHKQVHSQISQGLSEMERNMPSINLDMEIPDRYREEVGPFQRSKGRSTPKSMAFDDALMIGEILD